MKKLKTSLVALILILLTSITIHAQNPNPAVQQISNDYKKAMESNDLDAITRLYTNDASIRNADGSFTNGIEDITAQYKELMDNGKYNIELETIDQTMLDKNYFFSSGTYTFTQLNGEQTSVKGMFVNTLKKTGNEWKVLKSYRFDLEAEE